MYLGKRQPTEQIVLGRLVYLEDWYTQKTSTGTTGLPRKNETRSSSSLSTEITAKCFKDLNVDPETLKLSEEKLGKTVQDGGRYSEQESGSK